MTVQQHRDSAEINSSLMALKECFRAHAAMQRGEHAKMPFRRSRLTRVLRDCFTDFAHKTVVIATISPTATDVIHSVSTLEHAVMLAKPLADRASRQSVDIHLRSWGSSAGAEVRYSDKLVSEWTNTDVLAWLSQVEGGRFAHVVVPPDLDGRVLLGTSAAGLSELFEGALGRARGEHEGDAWTVPVDRVGRNLGRDIFAAARREAIARQEAGRGYGLDPSGLVE